MNWPISRNYEGTKEVLFEIHAVDHCNLWCQECCHFSPFFTALCGAKEYTGDQYVPWIDKMLEIGIEIPIITVVGGEPFLHSDLESFVRTLKNRYPGIPIRVASNGFWLRDERLWGKWTGLFKILDILDFSEYEAVKIRVGDFHGQMHKIEKMFPKCLVTDRDISSHYRTGFTRQAQAVGRKCHFWRHITLTADGCLWRCPTAAYAHIHPEVTKEFLAARDSAAYHLNGENKVELQKWLDRYPMETCSFCTLWWGVTTPHSIDPERFMALAKERLEHRGNEPEQETR